MHEWSPFMARCLIHIAAAIVALATGVIEVAIGEPSSALALPSLLGLANCWCALEQAEKL